ncbi:hypothetical protein EJB05_54576, partial [Eragrostis curvula]
MRLVFLPMAAQETLQRRSSSSVMGYAVECSVTMHDTDELDDGLQSYIPDFDAPIADCDAFSVFVVQSIGGSNSRCCWRALMLVVCLTTPLLLLDTLMERLNFSKLFLCLCCCCLAHCNCSSST